MIRVNLLPPYVAQRRLNGRLVAAYVIAVMLVGSAMAVYTGAQNSAATDMETQANVAEQNKENTDNITAHAVQVLADVQPTQTKLQFVSDVHEYTKKWVRLYDTLARYTDMKVIYSSAHVSGTTMTMQAYTPSIAEVGRYLEEIYNEPDFNTVSIDRLPGYPEAIIKKYYLDNKLVGIGSINGVSAGGGGGGGGVPGGIPNIPGVPGFAGGGGGGFGGASGMTITAGGQQLSRDGEKIYSVESVLGDRLNPLATPDERDRAIQEAIKSVIVKPEPKGFDVNVTASLKQPLVAPGIPGAGGGVGAASGGGGRGVGGPPPGFQHA